MVLKVAGIWRVFDWGWRVLLRSILDAAVAGNTASQVCSGVQVRSLASFGA
jgi:hypothetical protein